MEGAAARRGNRACLEKPEVMRGAGMGMDGDNGVGNSADGDSLRGRCEYRRWPVDLQGCTVARLGNDAERIRRGGDNTVIVLRVAPDTWSARRRANDAVVVVGCPENARFRQRGGPGIAKLPLYAERSKGRAPDDRLRQDTYMVCARAVRGASCENEIDMIGIARILIAGAPTLKNTSGEKRTIRISISPDLSS